MAGFNDVNSSQFPFFSIERKEPSLAVPEERLSLSSVTTDLLRVIKVCPGLAKTPVDLRRIPEAMTFFKMFC
ncbi:hypothetical protein RRG08_061632 [Elysia crispata]|uniref:Uncharacterized protein n=1 Tax=Elysia crispata TaxID=231223 RepID=A0AAE0YU00_9GAST|nr:hypothetical protein RRG08_061632 [Elysia crispata]